MGHQLMENISATATIPEFVRFESLVQLIMNNEQLINELVQGVT